MKTKSMNTRHLTEKTSAFLWSRAENTIGRALVLFLHRACRRRMPTCATVRRR